MLFILNRQEKVVGVLKNSGKNSVPFFNDLLTEDLATGSETFEFTTVSRNGIGQHLVVGNFIAFKKGTSYKLFQIMQTEEDHQEELYITVYAECAGLQLINSVFRGVKIVSASFERVMQTLLSDTSWNVGILPYGLATTYDLDIEQASVYSLLQTYAQQYGVELEFRVELNRGKISKKYIDGYYNRGKVTGKRFTYERDIEGIVRKTDATELYTALIGRGNNEISFKDVTVDGIDKPMGQDFVANQSAYEKYNNNGYHIVGIYECDTDDAKDLLRKTHKRLLEVSEPKVEYDISVLLLCELLGEKWNEVAIGDTISVFDNAFYPPIMVSARVSKLQTSMTDTNANKCTLANFIEVKSNITSEMRKIASQLQGYVDSRFPIGSSDIQDGAVGMDKISDIYTQTITTDILKAGKVETEKLIAQEAEITNAKIENLKAGFIEADKIITDTIVANKAEFDKLEAKVGKIDTLVSGNISSENIQTGGITGSNLNMDTIFVKDANILDLSASKLTAGEINTSKIVISSADGGMRLVGSTQQFVDENNRIRIQLGKDAKGDFDFYILAENGDILFNTRGITGNAIENGLIKEDMVSDGAIGGKKINWQSFTTEFNKDSNTHKLNSSKVLLDGTNQTLDIHFNRLNSTVNDNVNKTESNTTQLNVHQGKINTLIQDTTITKDGKNVKLKDEYSKLEQTVGGLKSTVGEQQTTINQNTGKITATESKVSTLEQTVNGFNSELSHVKTTIDEQEEAINSVNSALSGKANSNDVYKKSETMTTSAINSAINQSADSIKLGISETYETKTNVETKVTTTLNSAKSYADTKKSEAITQAGKDADSKVNSAKNELNTAINKKANSTDVYTKSQVYTKEETNSQIKVAKDEINLGVSNTYETKANVESKINTAVNNVQVGVRNLALGTGKAIGDVSSGTGGSPYSATDLFSGITAIKTNTAWTGRYFNLKAIAQRGGFKVGDNLVLSVYIKADQNVTLNVTSHRTKGTGNVSGSSKSYTNFTVTPKWQQVWFPFVADEGSLNRVDARIEVNVETGNNYIHWAGWKLEKGTKPSDWTPAPEDIDSAIGTKANASDVYNKSEVYTKNQTDSAINVAKDNINLNVSNTYETKTNVTTKVNNAKNEAINSANTTTTEKLKSYSTTEQMNSAINVAKDSITNTVSKTYATKSDVESTYATKSSLNQTANNITAKFESSGGYNLVENSTGSNVNNFGWANTSNNNSKIKAATSTSTKLQTRYCLCLDRQGETDANANAGVSRRFKLKPNTTYTVSGMVLSHAKTKGIRFMVKTSDTVDYTDVENRKDHTTTYTVFSGKVTSWTQKSLTFTTGASVKSGVVYFEHLGYDETDTGTTANRIFWSEVMLTEGSLVQQWSPHPNEVYSGSTIIDASGVTVNNGALRVKNNAGTTVLEGDSNGNLVFTGTAKSQKGDQFVSMDAGGLTFQDWNKSEQMLRIGISSFSSNRDMNGISFTMPQYSDFIRFSHIAKPDLTNGWSSTDTQYNFMDFWSSNQTVGGASYKKGINVYSPMYVNNGIQLFSGTDFPSEILGAISWDNGKGTIRNMMGLYGDNGAILGYKNGSNLQARILVSEASHPGTGDNIKSWGNWNLSGYTIHQGTFSGNHVNSYANSYTRTSAQTHCIEAEQKQIRVNFEDVQLVEGKAILNIPRKYVAIHSGYIVSSIVKKGRGDVWVSEETENRFTLEGTDDIKVNVEIVVKLEEASAYSAGTADDSPLCFDMSTGQPIV